MKECIIEGMLRRGEVGNVIASTKTGKSWFGLMLLLSIATGKDWLGRRVAKGPVLLIDNELHEETIENRLSAVRDKMNIRDGTPVAHDVEPALKAEKTRGDSKQEAKDAAGIDDLKKILSASEEPLSRNAMQKAFGGGKDRLNRLIRIGLEKESFVMVGTKEAQNGIVAELFTISSKEGANVQRSVSTV